MPASPKRAARKSSRAKKQRSDPPIQMIVRRGAAPRFDALKKKTRHLNVQVLWDRRDDQEPGQASVNTTAPPLKNRRVPPFTWDLADFVVVVPKAKRATRPK